MVYAENTASFGLALRRAIQLRSCLQPSGLQPSGLLACLWAIFSVASGYRRAQPITDEIIPRQMGRGYIRKEAEREPESNSEQCSCTVSASTPASRSLPRVSSLASLHDGTYEPSKSFLPQQGVLGQCFIT